MGVSSVPRGRRPTTRANPAGLTDRQVQVLDLMAQGLSNREIASRLVISAKTVEHHVGAVLRKLGVHTREQAATLRQRERDDKRQLGAAVDPETRKDLEHDLYAAKSRIADLMSELQEAHNEVHALRSNLDVHGARVSDSERKLEKLRRAAEAAKEAAANQEDPAVRIGELRDQLPAGVLSEYDTQREENGVGAAQFKANRACGGCFIVLPPAEQNAVRNAPADELPQCGDCGSYLVRLV